MSGGDGNGTSNTGLGHNGGTPTGNINGTSGSGPSGGSTGGWHWGDAPWSRDPDGQIRINFTGSVSYPTIPNGTGGGSGIPNKFTSNVSNWHAGYSNSGSLNSPAVNQLGTNGYQVSFGKEIYMVGYNPSTDSYKSVYFDGAATKASQLMDGQAIAVVQLSVIQENEKALLLQTSSIIADVGEKISSKISGKYITLSQELANDVKGYQGKKLRNYNDAIKTVNTLMGNALSHYSAADRTAIANALKALNASTIAANLKSLAKSFAIADRVIKIESVVEKTIHGLKTGEWGPLALELEAMVMSGVASGIALGVIGAILGQIALSAALLSAVSFMAIIMIAITASFIDADFAARINKEIAGLVKK